MKKWAGFGLFGIGFITLWLIESIRPSSRSPLADWREAERNLQEEKRAVQDRFNPQYSAAWRDLVRRAKHFDLADWGGIFLVLVACYALPHWGANIVLFVSFIAFLVGALLYGRSYFGRRINEFPCPRCEKPFIHIDAQVRNPLYELHKGAHRTRCQFCDLTLWARNADDIILRSFAEHKITTR